MRSTSSRLSRISWYLWVAVLVSAVLACTAGTASADPHPSGTVAATMIRNTAAAPGTPCFTGTSVCASSDPNVVIQLYSSGDTSACTFSVATTWGDGTSQVESVGGGGNGALLAELKHQYTKPATLTAPHTYPISWSSTVTSGLSCVNSTSSLQFTRTCADTALSGPAWAGRFPTSKKVSDLSGTFRRDVTSFMAAMARAKIKVVPIATLRPPQRAYLMHYSWLITKGQLSADKVPAFVPKSGQAPVGICWEHTTAAGGLDAAASVAAAKSLLVALGVDPKLKVAPALNSLHSQGLAIDMATTWTARTVVILNHSGHPVKITTGPRNGLNATLIKVGRTYGVIHYLTAAFDPNHWSSTGH